MFESGDLLRTAEKAHRTGAIVGGVYSKRSPDAGIAQRIGSREGAANAPAGLLPAEYVSGGFLAIPRGAALAIVNHCHESDDPNLRLTRCRLYDDQSKREEVFFDFFRPVAVPTEGSPYAEYLSEDWAWCHRARASGVGVYLDPEATLGHWGQHRFRVDPEKLYALREAAGTVPQGKGGKPSLSIVRDGDTPEAG